MEEGKDKLAAYYNEIDPFSAQWLRELIKSGLIAPGDVDERDIRDVTPAEVRGYTQCHFFAGIGVWSYALRRAGWPDDESVWTGSCPCQPFSTAGKRSGTSDERHLWPSFFHLIENGGPPVVFGEQVASKDGLAWLDLVQTDLEGAGYSVWPFDTCAAGFGAPHIRQRLYFVADSAGVRFSGGGPTEAASLQGECPERAREHEGPGFSGELQGRPEGLRRIGVAQGDTNNEGPQGRRLSAERARELLVGQAGVAGFWGDADWLWCRDQKYRPVEPGTFPLAHESPAPVGRLRGYGNAIVAEQAAEFIAAYRSSLTELNRLD
ncbi:DNA cytosine methyltransferase [Candidatus Amarobacter glycogenicus]|uniref:DNA cytosine methyltransferase n=1 Tax=Candidatus Amarobacter glycogenicus TaxID=3140699 RepID=UPI0031CC5AFF